MTVGMLSQPEAKAKRAAGADAGKVSTARQTSTAIGRLMRGRRVARGTEVGAGALIEVLTNARVRPNPFVASEVTSTLDDA